MAGTMLRLWSLRPESSEIGQFHISTYQYPCSELDNDEQVSIARSDREYIVELSYFTDDHYRLSVVIVQFCQITSLHRGN